MAELISSLAAGKDARATVVRASLASVALAKQGCPDSDGLIRFPEIPQFFQHGSGCLMLLPSAWPILSAALVLCFWNPPSIEIAYRSPVPPPNDSFN